MPPIMRVLIVCAFFYHSNSVSAFLDHEDVGVLVLSHLSHTWIQFQTLARFRAAWDHVRVNTLHDPTLFSILHSISESIHSQYLIVAAKICLSLRDPYKLRLTRYHASARACRSSSL